MHGREAACYPMSERSCSAPQHGAQRTQPLLSWGSKGNCGRGGEGEREVEGGGGGGGGGGSGGRWSRRNGGGGERGVKREVGEAKGGGGGGRSRGRWRGGRQV